MNEKQTTRPTKKQQELLRYIEQFISEHGYSPSYREIMNGLNYTSVATVALHVNSLIKRGHLTKRDNAKRSLEVLTHVNDESATVASETKAADNERWLAEKVEHLLRAAEQAPDNTRQTLLDQLEVVVGALHVLDLTTLTDEMQPRLSALKAQKN